MNKRKKKGKTRKTGSAYSKSTTPSLLPKEEIGDLIQQTIKEETTSLESPFGDIRINESMFLHLIRNKDFLYEMFTHDVGTPDVEKDTLEQLVYFEKINNKYPNEPYLRHSIACCYEHLKEKNKYQAKVKKNFEQFGGEYPMIDITYLQLMLDLGKTEIANSLVGEELNIHKIYPNIEAFDTEVVSNFYGILMDVFRNRKDIETAKKCAQIVASIDENTEDLFKIMLDFDENPWKRRGFTFLSLLGIVSIIAVILGIVWGIIKFFQWIF